MLLPGTEFMVRLQEQLKYFVHNKLSNDKLWENVKVYLSGHEVGVSGVCVTVVCTVVLFLSQ